MLGSIKNLQVIVHLCLMDVIVPANAWIFFQEIFKMIAFDPVDISEYIDTGFDLHQGEFELPAQYAQLGYESAYLLTNVGSLFLIIGLQLVLIPVYVAMTYCPCRKVGNCAQKKIDGCFFNGILAFIDGTFFVLIIMIFLNL